MKVRVSTSLSIYIGRQFLIWFAAVFVLFVGIIFLLDLIELLRRASGKPNTTFTAVLNMALFKVAHMAQKTVPFAVLFGSMLAFWRLNRNHELVAMRAAGVSVWQFLWPVLVCAVLIGGFKITAYNPVAAMMMARFEQLESKLLRGRSSLLAVSSSGIWLRQADETGQSVIHAARASPKGMELHKVMILLYEGTDHFVGRIDAASARLEPGYWSLVDAWISTPERPPRFEARYRLKTELTQTKILESFASPETISFWDLPGFIKVLEETGFSAVGHRLHWNSLLAEPLLICALVLIAAAFSLRHNRRTGVILTAAGGVATGFLLFFVTDLVLQLGRSASVPVVLVAWTPAAASTLLGLTTLLHLEDG